MASRAILRRKNIISDYLNVYAHSVHSFRSIGNSAQTVVHSHAHAYHSGINRPTVTEHKSFTGGRDGLLLRFRNGYFDRSFCSSGIGYGSSEMVHSMGMRCVMSISIRNATTVAAAKQPEEEHKKDDSVGKNREEASPEECDQAVVSLSSFKRAKAKAKRLRQSKKVAHQSIVERTWALVLGIGPALRAVASMSRADWAKKLTHWKQKFVSTLKRYWVETKLLWAETRIGSRLLPKLAGGKSLSRRERQQLTRTRAGIRVLLKLAGRKSLSRRERQQLTRTRADISLAVVLLGLFIKYFFET